MKPLTKKRLRMPVIVVTTTTIMFTIFYACLIIFADHKIGFIEYLNEKKGIAYMDKYIEHNPGDYMAYITLSSIYKERDEIEKALQVLNKAIERIPYEDRAYRCRSRLYCDMLWWSEKPESASKKQEYLEQAIEDISKAIELAEEEDRNDFIMRADLYMESGKYIEAIADLNKQFDITFSGYVFYDCYLKRSKAHLALKQYDKALTDLDKSLELNKIVLEHSERAETYYTLAKAFEDEGRITEAMQAYKGFLAHGKDKSWAEDYRYEIEEVREKIKALEML